jgi:hypothetical protein
MSRFGELMGGSPQPSKKPDIVAAPEPVVEEAAVEEAAPEPVVEEAAPEPVVEEAAPEPVVEEAAPEPVAPQPNLVSYGRSYRKRGTRK